MKTRLSLGLVAMAICCLVGCGGSVDAITVTDSSKSTDLPKMTFADQDWPVWRGLNGVGHYDGPAPKLTANEEPILWQTPVDLEGHASPILLGDKIYLSAADRDAEKQYLLCFDRSSGKETWRKELHSGGFMHVHVKNSQASATPCSDGENIFVALMANNAIKVVATDLNGEVKWTTDAGPFSSKHGYGPSPIVHESLVIVAGDSTAGSFLTAIHRKSGKIIWRTKRPKGHSFGSPVVAEGLGGKDQLLMSGVAKVQSYDPLTGKQNWESKGPADTTANTMVWNDSTVFASGGWPQRSIMAIAADGSKVIWEVSKKVYVPSMLVVDDRLFALEDGGIMNCYKTQDGTKLWTQRMGGDCTSSPVIVGKQIIVINERGAGKVFKAADKFEPIGQFDLGDDCFSTPVILDGKMYVRTATNLICLGE